MLAYGSLETMAAAGVGPLVPAHNQGARGANPSSCISVFKFVSETIESIKVTAFRRG